MVGERSHIESIATVLGGVAAAIFIVGVVHHIATKGGSALDTMDAASVPAQAAASNSLITLPPLTLPGGASSSGSSPCSSSCSSCGNYFYGNANSSTIST